METIVTGIPNRKTLFLLKCIIAHGQSLVQKKLYLDTLLDPSFTNLVLHKLKIYFKGVENHVFPNEKGKLSKPLQIILQEYCRELTLTKKLTSIDLKILGAYLAFNEWPDTTVLKEVGLFLDQINPLILSNSDLLSIMLKQQFPSVSTITLNSIFLLIK
jgi:hypothetical protein